MTRWQKAVNAAGKAVGTRMQRKMFDDASHVSVMDRAGWDAAAFEIVAKWVAG